jgi:hypothetical protein
VERHGRRASALAVTLLQLATCVTVLDGLYC